MTSRRLLILAAAAILVIGAGLWLASRQSTSGSHGNDVTLYPELKKQLDAVTAVNIYKPGDARAVEIKREASGWVVGERNGFPADEGKLRKLLRGLSEAKPLEEKTSNPDSYKTLGVEDVSKADASGVRIELVGPSSPVNLIVGKAGPGAQSSYVRRASEPQSWLVNASIDTSSSPDAWLRKDVIDVSADRVQSATVNAGAKAYVAAKASRADADFKVEGLPKGKELSSPSAANGFATALANLTLTDVQPASAFESTAPTARATLKTFDGLIAEFSGWTKDDKHYIAVKTSFDAAQAERFKIPTAPAETTAQPQGEGAPAAKTDGSEAPKAADAKPEAAAKTPAPSVEEQAKTTNARLAGWVYEIPQYKYEGIFKPLDELLKK